jgi:hypothetical protein
LGGCAGLGDELAGSRVTVQLVTASGDGEVTAASANDADHLFVTFGRVDLVPAGDDDGGGIVSLDLVGGGDLLEIDALTLDENDVAVFAEANDVPDGEYAQIRLIVESVELWFCTAFEGEECTAYDEFDVFVPSGVQTGLKINIEPPLVVGGENEHLLTVVFDVDEAIVETPPGSGNYLLKPTAIRVINEEADSDD